MKELRTHKDWMIAIATALILGALLAAVDGKGSFLSGWLAYGLLSGLGLVTILGLRKLLGADARAWRAALSAFFLRLLAGVLLTLLLPVAGYQDNPATQAGYVFKDAYVRDRQAYQLGEYGGSLAAAFTNKASGDQYGGLLALSALIYRYLSPGVHRPMLILILTAIAAASGVLFLWKAARDWFGEQTANIAAWIFAVYPMSVLLGSSQMREPFVIAAIAMAFYAVVEMRREKWTWLIWLGLAGILLFLFQPPVGLAAFVVLFVAWFLDSEQKTTWKRAFLFAGILILGIFLVFTVWASLPALQKAGPGNIFFTWLQKNFNLQSYLTWKSSQVVKQMFHNAKNWKVAIILAYGAVRPVLPAAIVDPNGAWIWRLINVLTSTGWYLLAPLLIYGFINAFRAPVQERRAQLIWLSLVVAGWVMIAAIAGGADQTDNPRYRTIFLAWQALLGAWAWNRARIHRDSWLPRWFAVEAACVLLFTEWYLSRYYPVFPQLNIWIVVVLCLVASALILLGGWLFDRNKGVESRASPIVRL